MTTSIPRVGETFTDDFDRCYRAVESRDRRFDGRFVTAVTSTGIYCRPSCAAQTPKRRNVRFYPVPAAAQAAGFRACKRCQPQAAPGTPDWNVRADLTARALRAISDGIIDDEGVAGLASRLAVSERHLGRLLVAEVGAGPLALARTRRAQTARLLIEETTNPVTDIAFSAGYSSVRQFNDSMKEAFGATPSQLRAARRAHAELPSTGTITLRLGARPPYDGASWLAWLAARTVPGLDEIVTDAAGDAVGYRTAFPLRNSTAVVTLTPAADHLSMQLTLDDLRDLGTAVSRCRSFGDLDADPESVTQLLGSDPMLAPAVAQRPGLRVPGTLNGFELACRAVVGQQVSVTGARTLLGRIMRRFPGVHAPAPFPSAAAMADGDLSGLGLTTARATTLRTLAAAVAQRRLDLDPSANRESTRAGLLAIPGIGPWTASYVSMRALSDPDSFPASDLGLLRGSARLGGPSTAGTLARHAARWSPWRSYAAQQLWTIPTDHEDHPEKGPRWPPH